MVGATIERGEVISAEGNAYSVRSLDREGIVSPPMQALDRGGYDMGDLVFFFLFQDGTGAIIGEISR